MPADSAPPAATAASAPSATRLQTATPTMNPIGRWSVRRSAGDGLRINRRHAGSIALRAARPRRPDDRPEMARVGAGTGPPDRGWLHSCACSKRRVRVGELNDEQRRAATHAGGPLLVLAGAGTGKTRTLVARAAWLRAQGIQASRILLLTFTRRAADDMLARVASVLAREEALAQEGAGRDGRGARTSGSAAARSTPSRTGSSGSTRSRSRCRPRSA